MATTATGNRSNAQLFALAFGVVYLAVGVIGFAITGFDDFAKESDKSLLIFDINPLHNIAHIGVGALLLAGSRSHDAAKSINLMVGIVYALLGVLGLAGGILVEDLLNNNMADTFLHLATAALAIFFGTAGATASPRPRTA
ncbi:MAG TPA: DUF4383 domain-containing protein [Actinomycetota bacterium]|nr:DUF4383 domain-containing protein [Actinomycetota bacterium]